MILIYFDQVGGAIASPSHVYGPGAAVSNFDFFSRFAIMIVKRKSPLQFALNYF